MTAGLMPRQVRPVYGLAGFAFDALAERGEPDRLRHGGILSA